MESKCHISWESWKIKFFQCPSSAADIWGAFFSHASPSEWSMRGLRLPDGQFPTPARMLSSCLLWLYPAAPEGIPLPKVGRRCVCLLEGMKDNSLNFVVQNRP